MRNFLCFIFPLAFSPALIAGEIVPTSDPGSDCVAPKIYAKSTSANGKYDEQYCSANGNNALRETCLHNARGQRDEPVAFFTDRCNEESEPAYVSFNGQTHEVWRQTPSRHPLVRFAGTYTGNGTSVRIIPKKLIRHHYEDSAPVGATYAVDVFIEHGKDKVKIAGVYDDSR